MVNDLGDKGADAQSARMEVDVVRTFVSNSEKHRLLVQPWDCVCDDRGVVASRLYVLG